MLLAELCGGVRRRHGVGSRWIGFEQALFDLPALRGGLAETPADGLETIELAPWAAPAEERRERFAAALEATRRRLADEPGLLVVVFERAGHRHDVEAAYATLAGATLLIVAHGEREPGAPAPRLAVGVESQLVLDPALAARGVFPAVDRRASRTCSPHVEAAALRRALGGPGDALYGALDALLAQPFVCAEPFTGRPGQSTPLAETLAGAGALLAAQPAR